jgi:hypothetical protein
MRKVLGHCAVILKDWMILCLIAGVALLIFAAFASADDCVGCSNAPSVQYVSYDGKAPPVKMPAAPGPAMTSEAPTVRFPRVASVFERQPVRTGLRRLAAPFQRLIRGRSCG